MTVYRAETLDVAPTRPEHVLPVVEVVPPGSETADRIVKAEQYARAGIPGSALIGEIIRRNP